MSKHDQKKLIADIAYANGFADKLEADGLTDQLQEYLAGNWWIFSHDENGNWAGAVANENGWTA